MDTFNFQQNITDRTKVPRQKQKIFRSYKKLLDLYNCNYSFVAFDTETTGLHTRSDYVIELGAVKFSFCSKKVETFNKLIKPPVTIPYFITNLTHIDNKMVFNQPTAKEVLPQFIDFLQGNNTILVAHNAPFDLAIINSELYRIGKPPLKNLTVDTLPLARYTYPELCGTKGNYSLQALAKRFCLQVKQAHRAEDDARVCMELFKKIINDTICKQKKHDLQLELSF